MQYVFLCDVKKEVLMNRAFVTILDCVVLFHQQLIDPKSISYGA